MESAVVLTRRIPKSLRYHVLMTVLWCSQTIQTRISRPGDKMKRRSSFLPSSSPTSSAVGEARSTLASKTQPWSPTSTDRRLVSCQVEKAAMNLKVTVKVWAKATHSRTQSLMIIIQMSCQRAVKMIKRGSVWDANRKSKSLLLSTLQVASIKNSPISPNKKRCPTWAK